jgi:hypothetical protein
LSGWKAQVKEARALMVTRRHSNLMDVYERVEAFRERPVQLYERISIARQQMATAARLRVLLAFASHSSDGLSGDGRRHACVA